MRQNRRGGILIVAATALAALMFPAERACGQAVFSGTGGSGPDLGIGRMIAPYAVVHAAEDWIQLGGELELRDIRPNGPAAGVLQDGDVLVAVDSALITTRAGSEQLFRAPAGRPLRLLVRRHGRDREVVVVPAAGKSEVGEPRTSKHAAPVAPARTGAAPRFRMPGWVGIGLACKCTVQATPDGAEIWSFAEAPEVFAVRPGGPAERAGILVGDLIDTVDGVLLTTHEGGRRWSGIEPGQQVRLGIRRGRRNIDLVVLAAQR
jgi:C-terminal processing protease CtpA/Prc